MSSLKHRGKGPQVMTANELRFGPVVYLDEGMAWTTRYEDALKTEDKDLLARMHEAADRAQANNLVVGAYFIDIDPQTGLPARYRERFRASGPSYDPGQPADQVLRKQGGTRRFGV